jgi:hypothetical protein
MARVYLETSFFSQCVTNRTGELDIGRRASSNLWWQTQAGRHDLFISPEVLRELSAPEFPNRDQALAMLRGLRILELTTECSVSIIRENTISAAGDVRVAFSPRKGRVQKNPD